ncbi:MAG: TetR/AcrR family transcriptional regulator, partial [Candidatus Marinimicrobia bacterium]|nr:TetR/AcrR family transcriptional regulator [Candidatus Neomarinimicrobiota bacterium]
MTRKSKEDIKQKILDTAETLFAQQGFDATGIDQIAKTAGITKSLIYYYFK